MDYIGNHTFIDDKLVFLANDRSEQEANSDKCNLYISNLDGTDPQLVKSNFALSDLNADENYIYVSDSKGMRKHIDYTGDKSDYNVNNTILNKDYSVKDKIIEPFHEGECVNVPFSIGNIRYFVDNHIGRVTDQKDYSTILWGGDKSKIGSYNGKEFEMTKIADITESGADIYYSAHNVFRTDGNE